MIAHAIYLSWSYPAKIVKGAVTLLLLAGLSLAPQACSDDENITFNTDGDRSEQEDGDLCATGDKLGCEDGRHALVCDENGESSVVNCREFCEDNPHDGELFAWSCSADSEEVCECDYGMVDGDYVDCQPGELYCSGNDNLTYCSDDYAWVSSSCTDYCFDVFGTEYITNGCNEQSPDNPCQCTYDFTDGVPAMCDEGDMQCFADDDATLCGPELEWQYLTCDELCRNVYGEEYVSYGCEPEMGENPCQCEYGMVDGDIAECSPGDLTCTDDERLGTCPNYGWEYQSCTDICLEQYGEYYESLGCNIGNTDNPCQCYGVTDGEPVECNPGDLQCNGDEQLSTCDNYYWESTACADVCHEEMGENAQSAGCDASNAENPCLCANGEKKK